MFGALCDLNVAHKFGNVDGVIDHLFSHFWWRACVPFDVSVHVDKLILVSMWKIGY